MIGRKSFLGGDIVRRILVSAQWDVWEFPQFSEYPLTAQRVLVISHNHKDHIDKHPERFNTVLYPVGLPVPEQLRNLKNLVLVDRSERIGKIVFTQIGPRRLSRILHQEIESLHARWWIASTAGVGVLFIGDLDRQEIPIVKQFAEVAQEFGVRCILLPSYGGLGTHGATAPLDMKEAVGSLAHDLNTRGLLVGGLPHPIAPDWTDMVAVRV
jgi:L-ascorbate metabolism protein UlaG (beta-lactamase superfamily)